MPSLAFKDMPWATHRFKCTLHSWSVVEGRDNHVSVNSFGGEEPSTGPSLSLDGEGVSLKGEFESTREDGELPPGTHSSAINGINAYGVKTPLIKESAFDNSSRLALISKSAVPSKGKSEQRRGFIYGSSNCEDTSAEEAGDDLALIMEIENDEIELAQMDIDTDSASDVRSGSKARTAWEDFSVREFCLIYRREDASRQKPVDLEAKVDIISNFLLFFMLKSHLSPLF